MLSTNINQKVFDADVEQKPTRDGFGNGAVEAGEKDERVVVLCADLAESTRAEWFQKKFPTRYIEVGVAEQNLAALGAGFAEYGKIPFITSYAAFNQVAITSKYVRPLRLTMYRSKCAVCTLACLLAQTARHTKP